MKQRIEKKQHNFSIPRLSIMEFKCLSSSRLRKLFCINGIVQRRASALVIYSRLNNIILLHHLHSSYIFFVSKMGFYGLDTWHLRKWNRTHQLEEPDLPLQSRTNVWSQRALFWLHIQCMYLIKIYWYHTPEIRTKLLPSELTHINW